MECSNCGPYRHNTSGCPDSRDEESSVASSGYSPWVPPFEFRVTSVFYSKGHKVFDMRGWGFLTGAGGGMGINPDESAKLQDEMGARIAALMNKDAGL